jgi:nucleoside-diphosphate-sugar epimerase
MNILLIGGTGLISTAVSKKIVENGDTLYLLNRGTQNNLAPKEANLIIGDYRKDDLSKLFDGKSFDVVVNFIAFSEEDVRRDVQVFSSITKQYVFISSASAYQKPVRDFPITEQTPLVNPFWEYSNNKIKCERYLRSVSIDGFHITIVRPSHTYDDTKLIAVFKDGAYPYGIIDRILKDKPYVIPGDGTSLWTLTHNSDFAELFVPLLGNKEAYGEDYHITSEFVYTWEQIYEFICEALGKKPNPIHIPTDEIVKYLPEFSGDLYGDKMYSAIFDNTKVKQFNPTYQAKISYQDVAKKAVKHYIDHKELQVVNEEFEARLDTLIADYLAK